MRLIAPHRLQDQIPRRYSAAVAARKARARKPQRRAGKRVRFTAALSLTRAESQRLEANAAADLRSVSNYVSRLVVEDQRLTQRTRRRSTVAAKPGERRVTYDVAVYITAAEKQQLRAGAWAEMRTVSSYVTKLVLENLHRR